MSEIRSQATPATNLETQLREALQTAARNEILRNPNSATQFKTQTKTNQDRIIDGFSAWVLPTILPIINQHIEETRT
ncbi:hypothetical protein [Rhodococcus sp. 008]|uniref:hypothetical protein n=1 Tax=Rhodococcus sp. 008 TaxID=1723645 RepID=UPI0008063B65|nr:hypothetical protein [Rhodococcus sp. 008]ANQ73199.1 hypothetical protein AOT96_21880 [Rhodococcus sp. 008]